MIVRLLARRSEHAYTDSPSEAMLSEPEAVTENEQAQITAYVQVRAEQSHVATLTNAATRSAGVLEYHAAQARFAQRELARLDRRLHGRAADWTRAVVRYARRSPRAARTDWCSRREAAAHVQAAGCESSPPARSRRKDLVRWMHDSEIIIVLAALVAARGVSVAVRLSC